MRSRTDYILKKDEVHGYANHWLAMGLKLEYEGRTCTGSTVIQVLLMAAARAVSVFAACRYLADAPCDQTIRNVLGETLPEMAELERCLNCVGNRLTQSLATQVADNRHRLDAHPVSRPATRRREGNPDSVVVPFDTRAYDVRIDPSDSILSLSERLAKYGGGGIDCSIPLHEANTKYRKRQIAGVLSEWQTFVANQQRMGTESPKLVCIDIQPYGSTQAPERDDILNIGGFSDAVFHVVASYLSDDAARFVAEVESIKL